VGFLDRLFGKPEPKPIRERTLETLQVDDVVDFEDQHYTVEQRIEYHGDGGAIWWDYLIANPMEKYFLGVTADDGLEVWLWREIAFRPEMPPPTRLTFEGEEFVRAEYGFADAHIDRRGRDTIERVEYWDYESASGKRLGLERWGLNEVRDDQSQMTGTIRSALGEQIKPYRVKIYQAEAQS
jgi:hypothetical protein